MTCSTCRSIEFCYMFDCPLACCPLHAHTADAEQTTVAPAGEDAVHNSLLAGAPPANDVLPEGIAA